jgi:hypothetical protein
VTRAVFTEFTITPYMNMGEIASTIGRVIREARHSSFYLDERDWVTARCNYNNTTKQCTIEFIPVDPITHTIADWQITMFDNPTMTDFYDLMNVPESERERYYYSAARPLATYPIMTFDNVWNRLPEQLYFHASFVNHTQFNYLGRASDFYPKPSKIFTADNLPMDFFFWTTTDISTPIMLQYEHFIIELAFIIDSNDYQSP